MGYNLTRRAVIRNLPQLQQMAEMKTSLRFPTSRPATLASNLREAIKAAEKYEDFYHFYEALYGKYKFREEEHHVIAEYQEELTAQVELVGQPGPHIVYPSMLSTPAPTRKTIDTAITLVDVMAAGLKFSSDIELVFPNARFSEDDKLKLFRWTSNGSVGWRFIDSGDRGITLTKKDVPEEVLWSPESNG